MRFYKVGGVVRDKILGRQSHDVDYVVVGATPKQMIAAGYQPVGKDFPVFIHPGKSDQYALARTERKKGVGHQGFVFYADPDVTLEQDLLRRDFTINAMARSDTGELIDPYGGRRDISLRTLRHVSEAFSEDPLRVLRAARYCADLDFEIAPETHKLICQIVASGELTELSGERIWKEFSRGLAGCRPKLLIETLRSCGALGQILPEIEALFGVEQNPRMHPEGCVGTHTLEVLHTAAINWWPLEVRLATLLHDVGKAVTPAEKLPNHPGHEEAGVPIAKEVCVRLRVPTQITKQVLVAVAEHGNVHNFAKFDAEQIVEMFGRLGVWRNDRILKCLLAVADCDYAANPQVDSYALHPNRRLIQRLYRASMLADVAKAAQSDQQAPAAAVRKLRISIIEKALSQHTDA